MEQTTLFESPQLRLRNGRYCTKEQYRIDKIERENKWLRYERDKYLNSWLAVAKVNTRLEQELKELKQKIKDLV